jgi:hypothetical protein
MAATTVRVALPINVDRIEVAYVTSMTHVAQSSIAIGQAGELLHSAGECAAPEQAHPRLSGLSATAGMLEPAACPRSVFLVQHSLAGPCTSVFEDEFTINTAMTDLTLAQIANPSAGCQKY